MATHKQTHTPNTRSIGYELEAYKQHGTARQQEAKREKERSPTTTYGRSGQDRRLIPSHPFHVSRLRNESWTETIKEKRVEAKNEYIEKRRVCACVTNNIFSLLLLPRVICKYRDQRYKNLPELLY